MAACGEQRLSHVGTALSVAPNGIDALFHCRSDSFNFSSARPAELTQDLGAWLVSQNPSVVHVHHYLNFGVEVFRAIRNAVPLCPIVLTLHEFLAICSRDGQMVKADGRLCHRETPAECAICVPQFGAQDFFMRKLYIKSFFDLVDCFVAPSRFLRDRYVEWGIPTNRIIVIENASLPTAVTIDVGAPRQSNTNEAPPIRLVRFAYFGQITPYKGVDLLIEAFSGLPEDIKQRATLEVHGAGHDRFGDDFRLKIETLIAKSDHRVRFLGRYEHSDLAKRLIGVDCVVVPSRWWENSPLIIQEAFAFGKPVICSDIGGMAEKVVDGLSGLHFRAGNMFDLQRVLERTIRAPETLVKLATGVPRPPCSQKAVAPFIDLYEKLLAQRYPEMIQTGKSITRPMQPGFVFVCSTGRAGSTLLAKQLSMHPEIVIRDRHPYETRFAQYLFAAKYAGKPAFRNDHESFAGASYRAVTAGDDLASQLIVDAKAFKVTDHVGLALEYYSKVADQQCKRCVRWIIEKAIGLQLTDRILGDDPDAKAITLVRDPRDTFCSVRAFNSKAEYSSGFGAEAGDEALFQSLITFVKLSNRLIEKYPGRVRLVRYEQLVLEPSVLTGVFRWLGVSADLDEIRTIWELSRQSDVASVGHATTPSVEESVGRWKVDATDGDLRLFAKFLRDLDAYEGRG